MDGTFLRRILSCSVERGYLARQVRAALEGDAASLYGGVLADIDSRRDERYEKERE